MSRHVSDLQALMCNRLSARCGASRRVAGLAGLAAMLACTGIAYWSGSAQAASGDRIGDAVRIVNLVTADYDKQQRQLGTGDDVRQDEVIEVSDDGRGELELDDDTKLALGAGARLVLDKFVYDSDKKTGSVVIDFAKGALRFITGVASKPTYVINTPNASITVRGTIFDVFILRNREVWVLLHEGALEVTGRNRRCKVLDEPGKLIRITSSGLVRSPVNWGRLSGRNEVGFEAAFPFVVDPPQIDARPTLSRVDIETASSPDQPAKVCANPHPPANAYKIKKAKSGSGSKPKKVHRAPPKKRVVIKKRPRKTVKRPPEGQAEKPSFGITIGIGIGVGGGGKKHRRPD